MDENVRYSGTESAGGLSYSLWHDCPLGPWSRNDRSQIYGFYDDFHMISYDPTTTTAIGPYLGFLDAGSTIVPVGDARYSGLILTEATANESVWLVGGRGVNLPFLISDTAGSRKKLWFEAEFALSSIAAEKTTFLCGLSNVAATASEVIPILADDTFASGTSFLGFRRGIVAAEGDQLDFIGSRDAAVTVQEYITDCHTLVANTFVKAGFKFDPIKRRVECYINGVRQSTFINSGTTEPALSGGVFPIDDGMHVLFGHATKATGGTDTLKWWACYQER